VRRLVLYEPPVVAKAPPGFVDRLAELYSQGRPESVVTTMLRDLAGMPAQELELAISLPLVAGPVAAAHTVVRELVAVDEYRFDPARFASLDVPTLIPAGSESPPPLTASTTALAGALPGARVVTSSTSCAPTRHDGAIDRAGARHVAWNCRRRAAH
jgi:hypothetical protein